MTVRKKVPADPRMMTGETALLKVQRLKTQFKTFSGVVKALQGVEFSLSKGETLGLVGETGCGKSVTALSILRLIQPPGTIVDGEVLFERLSLLKINEEDIRKIRGDRISMIFQEPMTSLNPVLKIGDQIAEVILVHQDLDAEALQYKIERLKKRKEQFDSRRLGFISKAMKLDRSIADLSARMTKPPAASRADRGSVAWRKAVKMLEIVAIPDPEKIAHSYPHELSGGMRQRAMIAMALACNPVLLMADEPTTALDVTVQAQIVDLMKDMKRKIDASFLLITHHLGLVAEFCEKVAVMYAGRIVEYTDTMSLFKKPLHPYTRGLLGSIPRLGEQRERLEIIPGTVPDMLNPPHGCSFHPRCSYATSHCTEEVPSLVEVDNGHYVSCFLQDRLKEGGHA